VSDEQNRSVRGQAFSTRPHYSIWSHRGRRAIAGISDAVGARRPPLREMNRRSDCE
jgi:hypothetical protein